MSAPPRAAALSANDSEGSKSQRKEGNQLSEGAALASKALPPTAAASEEAPHDAREKPEANARADMLEYGLVDEATPLTPQQPVASAGPAVTPHPPPIYATTLEPSMRRGHANFKSSGDPRPQAP